MKKRQPNRLINEKSPYLLQHAHNPVDWYPWGDEAINEAKRLDKPIFLSIGYATCHWCHVMEKESFEDDDIAKQLNDTFVNIKVDREELPQVDNLYMEFAQALMSSAGGWPLNVILTPDLKPFFAVTYLPPKGKRGLTGLLQFTTHIKDLWRSDQRPLLIDQAEKIYEIFRKAIHVSGDELPNENQLHVSVEMMFDLADPVYGGLKGEPKFPLGYQADFLLTYARKHSESRALFYIDLTLDMMRRGGIYDHIGGGFTRYAIDTKWQIPHFEKMLYDNAILARTYALAFQYTKNPTYERVCRETLEYLLRDMKDPQGGFYSAEDADIDDQEGLFYTWTHREIEEVLPPGEAEVFAHFYGMTYEGNFNGRNCLHIEVPLTEFAMRWSIPEEELSDSLDKMRQKVFEKRNQRSHPFKDDKIIVSWNGLAIDALACAGAILQDERYLQAAEDVARFIREKLYVEGHLLRRYREEEARFAGNLDDYAFMIKGLLNLYTSQRGSEWLIWAMELADVLERDFKAPEGAFYQTPPTEALVMRRCDFYDGAEPSGNGVHCENLLRLYQITRDSKYQTQAEDILRAAKSVIDAYPPGTFYHQIALQRYYDTKAPTAIIVLSQNRDGQRRISDFLTQNYIPHLEVLWITENDPLRSLIPDLQDKIAQEGQTTLYLCQENVCYPPLTGIDQIVQALEKL